MRVITHCPACQTQFFATEEQLNQHGGKVRCGQCMHVFDARAQMLEVAQDNTVDTTATAVSDTAKITEHDSTLPLATKPKKSKTKQQVTDKTPAQPAYIDGISGKSKLKRKLPGNKFRHWLWLGASVIALFLIITQSIYFLRNEIAIYYPQFKPILVKACDVLHCKIKLPEQIEFIVIDDSDMQEDPERNGLIYFSSTLINTGDHAVAYPNLELTLTDVEDNPVLRRIFKPAEYLPKDFILDDGFKLGAEIKIKLAISTGDAKVSGYRVFVTY